MKKLLLIFTGLVLFQFVKAQDSYFPWYSREYSSGSVYPGYIIKLTGDTIKGFLKYHGPVESENTVTFFSDPKDKKTKIEYKAEDLKGYGVANKEWKAMNYSGGLMAKPVRFLLRNGLGASNRIQDYTWFEKAENYLTMQQGNGESQKDYEKRLYPTKLIWQKGDEKPIEHTSFALGFAKKMSELVTDYPELSKKVAEKQDGYGLLKFYDIIAEYNTWYKTKK